MRLILSASNHHPFGTCVKHFGITGDALISYRLYEIAREWLLELLISHDNGIVASETLPERVMSFKLASMGRIIIDDSTSTTITSTHATVHVLIPFRMGPVNHLNRIQKMLRIRGYDGALISLLDDYVVDDISNNGIFSNADILRAFQLTQNGWGDPLRNLQMILSPGLYPPHDFETINQLADGFQDRYQLWQLYHRIQEKVHLDHWTLPTDSDSPYKIFKDIVDRCRGSPMADLMIMFHLTQLDETH